MNCLQTRRHLTEQKRLNSKLISQDIEFCKGLVYSQCQAIIEVRANSKTLDIFVKITCFSARSSQSRVFEKFISANVENAAYLYSYGLPHSCVATAKSRVIVDSNLNCTSTVLGRRYSKELVTHRTSTRLRLLFILSSFLNYF